MKKLLLVLAVSTSLLFACGDQGNQFTDADRVMPTNNKEFVNKVTNFGTSTVSGNTYTFTASTGEVNVYVVDGDFLYQETKSSEEALLKLAQHLSVK